MDIDGPDKLVAKPASDRRVVSEAELIVVVQRLAFRGEPLTARHIANAANIGTGTLYGVFPNLDELIGRARSDGAARILEQLDNDLFEAGYTKAVAAFKQLGNFARFVVDPTLPLVPNGGLEQTTRDSQHEAGHVMAGLTIAGLSATWPYEAPFAAAFAAAADKVPTVRSDLDGSLAGALLGSVEEIAPHIATTESGIKTETEAALRAGAAALAASARTEPFSFRALTEITGIPASTAHRYDDAIGFLAGAVEATSRAILALTVAIEEPQRMSVRFELASQLALFGSLRRTLWRHRYGSRRHLLYSALVLTTHQVGPSDLAWLRRAKQTLIV